MRVPRQQFRETSRSGDCSRMSFHRYTCSMWTCYVLGTELYMLSIGSSHEWNSIIVCICTWALGKFLSTCACREHCNRDYCKACCALSSINNSLTSTQHKAQNQLKTDSKPAAMHASTLEKVKVRWPIQACMSKLPKNNWKRHKSCNSLRQMKWQCQTFFIQVAVTLRQLPCPHWSAVFWWPCRCHLHHTLRCQPQWHWLPLQLPGQL